MRCIHIPRLWPRFVSPDAGITRRVTDISYLSRTLEESVSFIGSTCAIDHSSYLVPSFFFFFRLAFAENAEKRKSRVHILEFKIIPTNISVTDESKEKNCTSNLI